MTFKARKIGNLAVLLGAAALCLMLAPSAQAAPEYCDQVCTFAVDCDTPCTGEFGTTTCGFYSGQCCSGYSSTLISSSENRVPDDGNLCPTRIGKWLFQCHYVDYFYTCDQVTTTRTYRRTYCDGSIEFHTTTSTVRDCYDPIAVSGVYADWFCNVDTTCRRAALP